MRVYEEGNGKENQRRKLIFLGHVPTRGPSLERHTLVASLAVLSKNELLKFVSANLTFQNVRDC